MLALAVLAGGLPEAPAPTAPQPRPTVVVLDFDCDILASRRGSQDDTGRGVATRLVDLLVEDGRLRVIERGLVSAVLGEQDFGASDRASPDAARLRRVGRALAVRYVIAGSVHLAGHDRKDGKAGRSRLALTARYIDTTRGEVAGWAQTVASVNPNPELTNLGQALEVAVVALARQLLAQAGELSAEVPEPPPAPPPEPPPTPPTP